MNVEQICTRIFRNTSLALVGGNWKSGKTDTGLRLGEKCRDSYNLVSEVASNIYTEDNFRFINDTQTLKDWLSSDNQKKLFILDEGNEILPNTGFMSHKSVDIKSIIPQISKKRGRLIVIAHDIETLDKTFRSKTWWRATFYKINKQTVRVHAYWNRQKPIIINDWKRTNIKFDPYLPAEWHEQPDKVTVFKDGDLEILRRYANGETAKQIGIHREALNRKVRPFIARMLQNKEKMLAYQKEVLNVESV